MPLDDAVVAAFRERVSSLQAGGPGTFEVPPMHDIAVVRLLRDARDALAPEDMAIIAAEIRRLRSELHGIEHEQRREKQSWAKRLLRIFITGTQPESAKTMRNAANPQQLDWQLHSVGLNDERKLDVPEPVAEVAEAWLTAAAVEGRLTESVAPLRAGWDGTVVRR